MAEIINYSAEELLNDPALMQEFVNSVVDLSNEPEVEIPEGVEYELDTRRGTEGDADSDFIVDLTGGMTTTSVSFRPGTGLSFNYDTDNNLLTINTGNEDGSFVVVNTDTGEITDGTNTFQYLYRYLHVRFSANSDGSGFVTNPDSVTGTSIYIGLANRADTTAPTDNTAYNWTEFVWSASHSVFYRKTGGNRIEFLTSTQSSIANAVEFVNGDSPLDFNVLEINTGNIVDGAVAESKVATNAISTVKIQVGAVDTERLAANSVVAEKISANAVVAEKISANAVTADKINTNAVTAEKINTNAVTADKISANAVTAEKISANAVTADKINANAVTADKIDANAVTADKINANAVNASKINPTFGTLTLGDAASNIVQSGNYTAGDSGWQITGDGDAEFNNITVRGRVTSDNFDGTSGDVDNPGTVGFDLNPNGTSIFNNNVHFGGNIVGPGSIRQGIVVDAESIFQSVAGQASELVFTEQFTTKNHQSMIVLFGALSQAVFLTSTGTPVHSFVVETAPVVDGTIGDYTVRQTVQDFHANFGFDQLQGQVYNNVQVIAFTIDNIAAETTLSFRIRYTGNVAGNNRPFGFGAGFSIIEEKNVT